MHIEHQHGTDTIRAIAAELDLTDGILTFKAKLKPVDSNQTLDADRLRDSEFTNADCFWFHDNYIRKGMKSFVEAYGPKIDSCCIEIDYGQEFKLMCEIEAIDPDGMRCRILAASE